MFGRLIKYDLKSLFKTCVPLWLALLAVSAVNHFTLRIDSKNALPSVLPMMVYVGLMVAAVVLVMVLIIQRFHHGLLKDEGYLMFTLPVRPWQLVASKGLTAMVATAISIVVGCLTALVIFGDAKFWGDFFAMIPRFLPNLNKDAAASIALTVVVVLALLLVGITQIYAALALGHLAGNHRVGWAVAAFIGINVVKTSVASAFANLANHFDWHLEITLDSTAATVNVALILTLLVCVLQIAVFFFITERILSKRLNLE